MVTEGNIASLDRNHVISKNNKIFFLPSLHPLPESFIMGKCFQIHAQNWLCASKTIISISALNASCDRRSFSRTLFLARANRASVQNSRLLVRNLQASKTFYYWSEMCKCPKFWITDPKCVSVQNSGLLVGKAQVSKTLDYMFEICTCPKFWITGSKWPDW
jgi:hypothetical protein